MQTPRPPLASASSAGVCWEVTRMLRSSAGGRKPGSFSGSWERKRSLERAGTSLRRPKPLGLSDLYTAHGSESEEQALGGSSTAGQFLILMCPHSVCFTPPPNVHRASASRCPAAGLRSHLRHKRRHLVGRGAPNLRPGYL